MRKLGIALALVVAAALVTSTPAMAQAAKKKAASAHQPARDDHGNDRR